ncbi:Putative peptidase M13, metallopeptidase, catalytic domain superfamily, peptidase M13, domain 2 [Colletotrichum destructivum]|uniref:Peptidase M13, metallopeptidase, catalytic domain superfamily, peptidase M13, domain 2 n=1 Tax=Colletotrichum destructivum TaxID=34406 RepID=A0AAX4I6Q6_9PEZI|nr:Putative peptidase M13, metallopeptidase, catalytic domain superfamily, peptidase M13, domain 2 [Colletotrichum destructivum]
MAPTAALDSASLLCITPACLSLAADILFNLAPNHTEFDPCTDFEKVACGGFQAKSAPTGGSAYAGTFNSDSVRAVLKHILEEPYPSESGVGFITESLSDDQITIDKANFKLMTDAYDACMNYTAVEAAGLEPLIQLVDLIVEAFPSKSPNDLITKDDDLGKVLLIFAQHSIPTFEIILPQWDDTNPNRTIITVLPAGGSLLSFDEDDDTLAKYLAIQASVLQAIHPANLTAIEASDLALKITEFEENAGSLINDSKDNPTSPRKRFTLDEVISVAPELGHDFIIKNLSPPDYVPEVLNFAPGYFGNLSALLANTTADTLQGYFVWRAATAFSSIVEADVTEKLNDLKSTFQGEDPNMIGRRPRWRQCVSHIENGVDWIELSNGLGWILGRFFVDRAYTKEARELTTALLATIKTEFVTRLADKDWLSAEVKETAEEKVRTITDKIGYPDKSPETTNPQDLANYYSDLRIGDSYFNNTVETAAWFTSKLWLWLDEPTDKAIWIFSPSIVNAFYFPEFNDIFIQAGIQQQPLYDVGYPSYINYGGMGTILGHELTHGFDNQGHNYAPDGALTNWFDESSEDAFSDRAECFAKQYSEFSVASPNGTRVYVNGNATLGENIADAGGVANSFAAWKRQQADGKTNDCDLPGLGGFTHEQLFFVKYAQNWCQISDSRALDVWLINNDPHAPGPARIKGPLDNSEDFKKAFNCPVKEPRCELW